MRRLTLVGLLVLTGCRQGPLPSAPVAPASPGQVEALPPASADPKAEVHALWQKGSDAKHAGDKDAARAAWQQALKADPGNTEIERALAALDRPVAPASAAPRDRRHGERSSRGGVPSRHYEEPASSAPEEATSAPPASTPRADLAGGGETVYVTDTGHKYHSSGCRYLRHSSHPMARREAEAAGYTACSVCGG